MATITLYASKINQMPGLLKTSKQKIVSFKGELQKLNKKILKVDGSACDVYNEAGIVQASVKTQEGLFDSISKLQDDVDEFISDTVNIDNNVASLINANKKSFYKTYSYLKPECEKSTWEKVKDGFKKAGQWCKEHWVEILIGLAFIVVGALITVFTAGTGTAFWASFGAAFFGGLKFALVSALISGGINIAVYTGSTLLSGKKLRFSDAMSSFGDGFASGFMWGGITAGVAMTVSAGFRIAASKGVTAGPKNLKNGIKTYPDTLGGDGCGGGTIRNFAASRKAPGFRFDVDIRVLGNSKWVNKLFRPPNYFHMHLPFVGTKSITALGIVNGHIPVGLYSSGLNGSASSNSNWYSDFKKWQRESWRSIFGN